MIEYRLKLAGCDCAVVEWNPGGSIFVFALHGWLDNLASFEGLIEHMPEVRLVAVDFPGHGHSEHIPPGSNYYFIEGLYLIDDLARHFKLQQINILGHSMGGAISTLYAASQSKKVNKLVLIDSLGPLTSEPHESVELMRKAINQRAALMNKRKPVYTSFEQALEARASASQISRSLIKPLVERALTTTEGGYTWRADSRLRVTSPLRMSEPALAIALPQITAQVLLIEGENGLIINNEILQARKKNFVNLRECTLKGGHHVHLEQPRECGQQIQAFFKAID